MARGYCLGMDFGTLSARALIVDAVTGEEMASAVSEYRHGVMAERLPGTEKAVNDAGNADVSSREGKPLPPD